MAEAHADERRHRRRLEVIGGLTLLVAVIAIGTAHYWPSPAGSAVPAAYQNTWNGKIGVPMTGDSVQLSLTLHSGGVNDVVGSVSSSTFGCVAAVILTGGNGPITLRLTASDSASTCLLMSLFSSASATFIGGDELEFSVDVDGVALSCDLYD